MLVILTTIFYKGKGGIMKAKNLLIIATIMVFIGMSTTAFAFTEITGQTVAERVEGGDLYVTEEVYGDGITNSGDLMGIFEGNDSNQLFDLQNWLITDQGYDTDFVLVEDFKFDIDEPEATKSGTWASPTSSLISLYVVKAADGFALYDQNPAATSGTWSTYDLWQHGYGGNGGLEISHISGYDPGAGAPVPEPSTVLLLGCGLLGLVAYKRKRK